MGRCRSGGHRGAGRGDARGRRRAPPGRGRRPDRPGRGATAAGRRRRRRCARLAGHDGPAAVVASGDPGLLRHRAGAARAPGCARRVLPAVSSVAHAFARLGMPWDDALVVSAHGRELRRVVNACRAHRKVAVLTGPGAGPRELAPRCAGLPRRLVVASSPRHAGGAGGRPGGRGRAERHAGAGPDLADGAEEPAPAARAGWPARSPGRPGWALPEDAFDHRDSMITKAEVRALALARLGPRLGDLVWDVGAGSGSVAVECARFGAAVDRRRAGPGRVPPRSPPTRPRTGSTCRSSPARRPRYWRACPTRTRCSSAAAGWPRSTGVPGPPPGPGRRGLRGGRAGRPGAGRADRGGLSARRVRRCRPAG